MFDKSSNPVFKDKVFSRKQIIDSSKVMTVKGAIEKTGLLLLIVIVSASFVWNRFFNSGDIENASAAISGLMVLGGIGGFVVAMATIFMKRYAAILSPIYAILEGLFLGGISAFFETSFPGIVMNAVMGTFGTFLVTLMVYRTGLIKVTEKFRSMVLISTMSIAMLYFLSFILSWFNMPMTFLHDSSMLSIGISLFVIVIAAFNLLLDFDMIERTSAMGAPKYMEWFSAFGIMVTLVWLYLEILNLLAKLRD